MSFPRIYELYRYVKITDRFEGFHAYPDAPDEVAFLRYNHRHVFHVTMVIGVEHQDREIEFFMAREHLKRAIAGLQIRAGGLGSCEDMAEHLFRSLVKIYGDHRYYHVEVSEDGENGGCIEFLPEVQIASNNVHT